MSGEAPLAVLALPSALPELLGHVEERARAADLDAGARFDLRLAVEEIVTNIIRHGYADGAPGPIEIDCRGQDGALAVTIADRARPFDPASAPPPDLDSGWRERRIGGLGWHLTRAVVDDLKHEVREGGGNRWSFSKRPNEGRREGDGR